MTPIDQHRNIRATMMQHGVTLVQIAKQERVSKTYVTFVVTNRRTGYRIRRAIATACGVPVEYLWPDTPINQRGPRLAA